MKLKLFSKMEKEDDLTGLNQLALTEFLINANNGSAVSWNKTGFESYPPSLDTIRQFFHFTCVGFGLPLNIMVASVIFRQRRLRNPRNTFWLGIIFCNLLAQTNAIVEYVAFELLDITACIIFRITAGIPYTLLLVNLLLATLDRWVALTYPLFHRENVTVKVVVFVQAVFFVVVVSLSTLPYWAEIVPLAGCGVHPTVLKWTTIVFLSLTVLSIITQVQIYRKARSCLRRDLSHHLFNHQPRRINRLELEATVTLVCGVMSLSFFSLPYSTFSMGDWICKLYQVPVLRNQKWCTAVQFSLPYARELFLVHSVYNPIMYMIRSREFSDALRSIVPCHRKE